MLFFYLCLAIGVSFLCSLYEAIILSVSPAYIASRVESGKWSGKLLQRLKSNIDDSLSAILTLNTIAHTIGSVGVGAEILKIYGDAYVAIGSVILTLLILVLSEIIPKTLGATYWRSLAPYAARGIQIFIIITYPFVIAFKALSNVIGSNGHEKTLTRDEILYTAEIGHQEGTLSEDEASIIKNLLQIRKVFVRDVMTPRTVVFALKEDMTIGEVQAKHPAVRFSRIPIFHETIDNLTGFITRYELVNLQAEGKLETKLSEFAKPMHGVPDTINIGAAFNTFMKQGEHLFAVYDEHGSLDGVIALEDVIETLLGVEITDEFDFVEDMRAFAAKKWEKRRAERRSNRNSRHEPQS
ncbi:CNNM domain-containing protein [Oligoflexia bacterium]|nr:CNNM domain-containing protein [Oligoflexia bacterium]